jgi:hypothetical protein
MNAETEGILLAKLLDQTADVGYRGGRVHDNPLEDSGYTSLPGGTYLGEGAGLLAAGALANRIGRRVDADPTLANIKKAAAQRTAAAIAAREGSHGMLNATARGALKLGSKVIPAAPRVALELGAAIGGATLGEKITGETFWEEATLPESLGSVAGSIIGGIGGSFVSPIVGTAAGGAAGGILGARIGRMIGGEPRRKKLTAQSAYRPTVLAGESSYTRSQGAPSSPDLAGYTFYNPAHPHGGYSVDY